MLLVIYFILLIILIPIILWLVGFFAYTSFSYPNLDIKNINRLLLIFPHPDDEVLTTGGLIKQLSKDKKHIVLHLFTKGERGNEGAKLDLKLKQIREKEAKKVAQILGINKIIHEDLGDGTLHNKKRMLEIKVTKIIKENDPDTIITYDLSGLYGHPDHIAVSEAVTNVVKNFRSVKLLYVSMPPGFYQITKLPTHMAKDPEFMKRKSAPTKKFFTGRHVKTKIKALNSYESQLFAFKKSRPAKFLPLWFSLSTRLYEYYSEIK